MMPVAPWAISRVAAAVASLERELVRSTRSAANSWPFPRSCAASNAASFRSEGTWSGGPRISPIRSVAQVGEVRVGLLHRDGVVGRDARKIEVLRGGVDEHDRQAKLQQPCVVLVRRVGFGVLPAGKDHPRHLPLEQHFDVLGLRHAAGSGAENGVEPALGQRAARRLPRARGRSGFAAPGRSARPCAPGEPADAWAVRTRSRRAQSARRPGSYRRCRACRSGRG